MGDIFLYWLLVNFFDFILLMLDEFIKIGVMVNVVNIRQDCVFYYLDMNFLRRYDRFEVMFIFKEVIVKMMVVNGVDVNLRNINGYIFLFVVFEWKD